MKAIRFFLQVKIQPITYFSNIVNSLLKKAQRGGLILRSPEGQEFILAEIRDFSREIELTRQNKALMRLLDARGKQTKTVKTAGLKKQLGLD
ncbi:MAG TPA: hypothetical protein VK747_22530 [Blastocatellia bacterium]|jgi:hypothetical protein|nr:hypothetical protein [Blastocatellia bacterium]